MATDFAFDVLEQPADVLVDRARRARDMLAEAEAEAAAIRAAAHAEGLAAGRAEALAAAAPAESALIAAGAQISALRDELSSDTEAAAVELALRVAEQIVGGAIAVEPERVLDVLRGALRRLVERRRVLLLVHPDDLELVRGAADRLVAELGGVEACEVQAERRVPRGGAVVRTEEGEVDATIATKLDRAREVLEAELAGAPSVAG